MHLKYKYTDYSFPSLKSLQAKNTTAEEKQYITIFELKNLRWTVCTLYTVQ